MFCFTIRDLLWLIAFVSVLMAWWVDIHRRDSFIQAAKLQVEDAEFRVDRARAKTKTVREAAEEHEKDLVFGFRLELARIDPIKRAEFEREYPKVAKLFFPDDDPAD
jgi:hypothetical protein